MIFKNVKKNEGCTRKRKPLKKMLIPLSNAEYNLQENIIEEMANQPLETIDFASFRNITANNDLISLRDYNQANFKEGPNEFEGFGELTLEEQENFLAIIEKRKTITQVYHGISCDNNGSTEQQIEYDLYETTKIYQARKRVRLDVNPLYQPGPSTTREPDNNSTSEQARAENPNAQMEMPLPLAMETFNNLSDIANNGLQIVEDLRMERPEFAASTPLKRSPEQRTSLSDSLHPIIPVHIDERSMRCGRENMQASASNVALDKIILQSHNRRRRKHLQVDVFKTISNHDYQYQIEDYSRTMRCKIARNDIMPLFLLEKYASQSAFSKPIHRCVAKEINHIFDRNLKTRPGNFDQRILMDILKERNVIQIEENNNVDIRKPPSNGEMPRISQTNAQEITELGQLYQSQCFPLEAKRPRLSINGQPNLLINTSGEELPVLNYIGPMPPANLDDLNSMNGNGVEISPLKLEEGFGLSTCNNQRTLSKLTQLWNQNVWPLNMDVLCQGITSRKSAALIFLSVLELVKTRSVVVEKKIGSSEIFHIRRAIKTEQC